ncbi:3-phosphoshikimate 1-carboxyvinyltransferase [Arcanobacterium haemolyticum]|nr:3-phosphoshikimate 1-carboxyvinyltransferase [Arcanobacterium haemolyticum]
MVDSWASPYHPGPITTNIRIPGSKSLTNRYLVLAALGDQPSVIREPLVARDTVLMAKALEAMGMGMEFYDHELFIYPAPLHGATVEVGLAGTVMRFLPAVATLAEGPVHFDGDAGARVRPMDPVVQAIRQLGVDVTSATNADGQAVLPLTVHGRGHVDGGHLRIDASASSQFISALLLAAPRMKNGMELRHVGSAVPSTPHLDMTVDVLRSAGIDVSTFPKDAGPVREGHPAARWIVRPGIPDLGNVEVEPDLSNAGAFLAAAMVTGGSITIPSWPRSTTQPGDELRTIFSQMGAHVELSHGRLCVTGPSSIRALDRDLHDVGELVPTIAAVAAFADGTSVLRNIGQLRGHETDRLAALTAEFSKLGGKAWVEGDDLHITPMRLHGGVLETYADHRMATFAAIIGLRVEGVRIINVATTSKTLPQFTQMWTDMTHGISDIRPHIRYDESLVAEPGFSSSATTRQERA